MSQHQHPSDGDAGADEEFVDRSLTDDATPAGKPGKAPREEQRVAPAPPKRGPRDRKPRPEPHSKANPAAKDGSKPDAGAGIAPEGAAASKAPAEKDAETTPSTSPGEAPRTAAAEKQGRPAKAPRHPKPAVPHTRAEPNGPVAPAAGTKPAPSLAAAPRDPGGYPEFHAPTRPRKDGKPAQTIVFLHGGNVANWTWDPQVRSFGDYEVLTPHLPGFGARAQEDWAGLDSAADDVAAVIADEVSNGGAHLVGLSLGGVIALRVLARHPELVESLMISGVPAAGVSTSMRTMSRMQLRLFGSEWYWRFQAGAYGMVADEKELFTEHGTHLRADNMRAIMDEVDPGGVPAKLGNYKGPALVIAGSKEPKLVAKSFPALARALPQAQFRTAVGMHHQWNIEDPILFNATVRAWVEKGTPHPRLQEPGQ
ncbi:alpha/beta fold hydrolase [Paeniglutamicibacter sp. ABSL32-1]|uniref:alpha/beta fold hydrolase n=1 Tax=Paeniglutamicibacter quisquiliarum TaxID=2849498 RepID=UPI001C2D851E|nr:alpha/beta fold hydrolase [Paeniglutamicibacter quisquiliarum]MBV1780987.1 alpha/beta fold hydrolase [Paeniglutamicibacter quisquiliarum]